MELSEIFTWPPTPTKWRALRDYLTSTRLMPGLGVRISKSSAGILLSSTPPRPESARKQGPFFTLYSENGHTYLLGGSITGGHGGSATIDDIKVIDADAGPIAADGHILFLSVECTATIADGIMLPGVEVNSATTGTGESLPAAHTFTITQPTGNLRRELGRFAATAFQPSSPGHFDASGCIGNFTLNRV